MKLDSDSTVHFELITQGETLKLHLETSFSDQKLLLAEGQQTIWIVSEEYSNLPSILQKVVLATSIYIKFTSQIMFLVDSSFLRQLKKSLTRKNFFYCSNDLENNRCLLMTCCRQFAPGFVSCSTRIKV